MSRRLPAELRPLLESLRARHEAAFPGRVHDVRLFGSWARGEQHQDSDVDVVIVIDGLTDAEHRGAANEATVSLILDEASEGRILPLSTITLSTEHLERMRLRERPLAEDLDREGISV